MNKKNLIRRIEELELKQIELNKKIELIIKWIDDNVPKKPIMMQTDGPIMNKELWLNPPNLNRGE
jgi:hypothetical protein